ncbi:MAG TPA: TlpA disulfide reductase family protein [Pedobacter sp.]
MNRLKLMTTLLACMLAGAAFAQEDPDMQSTAIQKQKQELDTALSSIQHQLVVREKTFRTLSAENTKAAGKYDTTGLWLFRADMAALKEEKHRQEMAFITAHPDYFISLAALNDVIGPLPVDVPRYIKLFNQLDAKIRQTPTGVKTKTMLDKFDAVRIGKPAPLFTSADTAGKAVSLKSYRGKYVLLDFWASWCVPCREENPNVVAAYNKYKNKNFDILSVSLDQTGKKAAWIEAIKKDGLTWQHVSDLKYWNSEVAQLYMIKSIPQNFLIDPNGKIIAANLRGEALNKKLAELLK